MEHTVDAHFAGKHAVVADIYTRLLSELGSIGPLREEPKKTSIHLVNRYAFAGVYTRSSYINLEFHTDSAIRSPRILKMEQASAHRYHHTVRLDSPDAVDTELMGWLRDAYRIKG